MNDDDLAAREREFQEIGGYDSPRGAIRSTVPRSEPPYSAACLRQSVPTHQREPPKQFDLADTFAEHPLPRGSLICGPVIRKKDFREAIEDGAGWLINLGYDSACGPIPVVTGRYYDGTPRLGIIAEMLVPERDSQLADAMGADDE